MCLLPGSKETIWRPSERYWHTVCSQTAYHILNEEKPDDFIWWNTQEIVKNMQDTFLLKFMSAKQLLSLTYTAGSPGYWLHSHNSKSLFDYSDDLYQPRRFLLLSSFELHNFKQTAGSYTHFLNCNYFVPSVLISRQALVFFAFYNMHQANCYNAALILRGWWQPLHSALSSCGGSGWPH